MIVSAVIGSGGGDRSPVERGGLFDRMFRRTGKLVYSANQETAGDAGVLHRYRWAREWAAPLAGTRVADVGCWTGGFLGFLLAGEYEPKPQLVGIDIAGPWIDEARTRVQSATFETVAALTDLPPGLGPFDTVFLLETLEHLARGSEIQVLQTLYNLLAPDGQLIVSTPAAGLAAVLDPAWILAGHRHYRVRTLETICSEAGLAVDQLAYSGNTWSSIDVVLLYLWKHLLRLNYRTNAFLLSHSDTGLTPKRSLTSQTIWLRLRRR